MIFEWFWFSAANIETSVFHDISLPSVIVLIATGIFT